MGSFRDLAVYERAVELADDVHHEVVRWPSFDRWTLGIQLVRAADSVGANIAEASGRGGSADQRRLFLIARGSALETEHWLDRAVARDLPLPAEACPRAAEVGRMLNGLLSAN